MTTTRGRRVLDRMTGDADEIARFEDVESSEEVVGRIFYPHKISVTKPNGPFDGTMSTVHLGPIVMAELNYNIGLYLNCPHIDAYHLNMPVRGSVRSQSLGQEVLTEPGRAAIYRYGTGAVLQTVADTTFYFVALKIAGRALEGALAALLGRPVDARIDFAPEIDLRTGMGRQWWELLMSTRTSSAGNSLFRDPAVANPLGLSLLTGLLLASGHQFSESLHTPPPAVAPVAIRRAVAFIHEHLHEPITMATVAEHVGISTRSLHRGFVSHYETAPHEFLKSARLDRAHLDLVAADPDASRVADIANRWGFAHLGRFARDYRIAYGVSPSDTLRS